MTKDTKKRQPNFTQEEQLLLSGLVAANSVILEGKLGPGVTAWQRRQTWQKITNTLNKGKTHKRTKEEVRKKWKNLKSQSKQTFSNFRQQTIATEGGPPPIPVSPVTDAVAEAIGRDNMSLTEISDFCDSTALQLLDVMRSKKRPTLVSGDVEDMANAFHLPERTTCQCQQQQQQQPYMEELNKEKLLLEIECLKLKKKYLKKKIYKLDEYV
ncbi:uncharacterized protein LOC124111322 [Haliotis rufescens]|uniref:uncharacterized protein LOC124111322 n=1 Tax=Haliotis rufescens TaxID=6454 RepID=UPI00201F17B4|nr:uncharacterized protein LOC124111322 [Haliotis rufescens]